MSGLEETLEYQCPYCHEKVYYWILGGIGWLFSDAFLKDVSGTLYRKHLHLCRNKTLNDVDYIQCKSKFKISGRYSKHTFSPSDSTFKEVLMRCWMAFNSGDVEGAGIKGRAT